jgi:ParB/RepB/Spo0J family partition protein
MPATQSVTHTGQTRALRGGGKPETRREAEISPELKMIPIGDIVSSKTNPRKRFVDLDELAASIASKGILEPLLVRPKGKRFEIVAGERRFRSGKIANLERLLCLVRKLSDADAVEIQAIENLQRSNLTPLEEAASFRQLIDTKPDKHSAESIGKTIGKSASWVWDVMKILDLVPEAKQLLDDGKMSINHAIPIARLTATQQKKVIDPDDGGLFRQERHTLQFDTDDGGKPDKYDGVQPVSVKELQAYIADHVRFDPHKAAAAAPLLFENTAERVDEAAGKPGRGKKVIAITHNSYVQDDAKDPNERTFSSVSWERADGKFDSKTCDSSVLGVIVVGRGYGDAFDVCVARDKCKVHWAGVIAAKEKRQKQAGSAPAAKTAGKSAKAAEAENRRRAADDLKEKTETLALNLIRKAAEEKLAKLPTKLPKAVFDLTLKALKDQVYSEGLFKAKGITQDNLVSILAASLAADDLKEIDGYQEEEALEWAKALGVDLKKLRATAEAQIKVQTSGEKKKKAA